MFTASVIDPQAIAAYRETEYRVGGRSPVSLQVGAFNPQLAALHKEYGVVCSAFITACNPFSQSFDDDANVRRQLALAKQLRELRLEFIEGIGQHPSNGWPGEPSFLILGLSLDAAKTLGTQHEQNAIVWCGPDATPELVLLR